MTRCVNLAEPAEECPVKSPLIAGFGGRIIGTSHPLAEDAEFFWFADGSSSAANNDKYAVFAPDGIASNKMMADVNHHIVLATASGNADQK